MRWVEDTGRDGVAALRNLEAQEPDIGPHSLRAALRTLLTAEARRSIVPALRRPGVTLDDVTAACADAAKDMWVAFHWSPSNPLLSPQ